jgi:hypothetical protein
MKRSETIGAEEDFEVGGSKMQFPGDRRGGPSEVINCRCALGWRRIEEETPAPPPPQANIPTPIIPEKPTGTITPNTINSIEDAEKYFKENGVRRYDVGVKRVSIHKAIAQAHADTLGKFGVELNSVIDSTQYTKDFVKKRAYRQIPKKAKAAAISTKVGNEFFPEVVVFRKSVVSKKSLGYVSDAQKSNQNIINYIEAQKKLRADALNQLQLQTDDYSRNRFRAKINKLDNEIQKWSIELDKRNKDPWSSSTISNSLEEEIYVTGVHEFGHILDFATKDQLREIAKRRHMKNGVINGPTRYGSSNSEELVAEIFAGYHKGDLAPEFIETYKEFERYINDNIKEVRERAAKLF